MQSSDLLSPQTPHFFKILLADTLREGKIEIPKKFVRKYGNGLSNPIVLRLPDGKEWQMGLAKSDGTVWLQNGWQEFAQHYRLKQGSFLVFRYEGRCCFHVLIFDLSASEIDYPRASNAGEVIKTNREFQEQVEDDVSVEILSEASYHRKMNGSLQLPSPYVEKQMEDNADHRRQEIKGQKRWKHISRKEKPKALKRASGFKSKKPFFKVVMYPSYVGTCQGGGMVIPADFARKYTSMKSDYAYLRLASGRSWQVKYHCLRRKKLPNSAFRDGWREFARDNHLQVGDVCVFELINRSEIMFEVTIYRDNRE